MRVEYTKNFKKQFKKIPPKTQKRFQERLDLFLQEPTHPLLKVHSLTAKYAGCMSMNITADVRLIFEVLDEKELISLIAIGSHSQLYS